MIAALLAAARIAGPRLAAGAAEGSTLSKVANAASFMPMPSRREPKSESPNNLSLSSDFNPNQAVSRVGEFYLGGAQNS